MHWIELNENYYSKVVCTVCSEAIAKNLVRLNDRNSRESCEAFVDRGFTSWKNAISRFENHEKRQLHRDSVVLLVNLKKPSIEQRLNTYKQKELMKARIALDKIFSTVNFLARQGLALRGHETNSNSNLMQLLHTSSEDCPELKVWLQRQKIG